MVTWLGARAQLEMGVAGFENAATPGGCAGVTRLS
jgi:hypothetical protein